MLVAQPPRKPAFNRLRESPRARILLNERLHRRVGAELLRDGDDENRRNESEWNQHCQDLSGSKPSLANTNLRQSRLHLRNSAGELMRVVKVSSPGKVGGQGCIGWQQLKFRDFIRRRTHMQPP